MGEHIFMSYIACGGFTEHEFHEILKICHQLSLPTPKTNLVRGHLSSNAGDLLHDSPIVDVDIDDPYGQIPSSFVLFDKIEDQRIADFVTMLTDIIEYEQGEYPYFCYMTEHNVSWSLFDLLLELERERIEITKDHGSGQPHK